MPPHWRGGGYIIWNLPRRRRWSLLHGLLLAVPLDGVAQRVDAYATASSSCYKCTYDLLPRGYYFLLTAYYLLLSDASEQEGRIRMR